MLSSDEHPGISTMHLKIPVVSFKKSYVIHDEYSNIIHSVTLFRNVVDIVSRAPSYGVTTALQI